MKIGINGKAFGVKEKGGAVRAAISLVCAIAKARPGDTFILFMPVREAMSAHNPAFPDNVIIKYSTSSLYETSWARTVWEQMVLPWQLRQHKDISLLLNLTNSTPLLSPSQMVQLVLIHDVGFLKKNWFSQIYGLYLKLVLSVASRKGAYASTVSEESAKQIREAFPHFKHVATIYNGVDNPPPAPPPLPNAHPYILFLGSVNPRKNLEGALRGFQLLKAEHPSGLGFVIVGAKKDIFVSTGEGAAGQEDVVFKGYVSEAEKWALLRGAKLLLLPSFLEGFGLPIVEAMKVGTPVVASHIPVFKELFGDHIVYIDPHDPRDMAKGMRMVLEEGAQREKMTEKALSFSKTFSWAKAGEAYDGLIEKIMSEQKPSERTHEV